jgi:hypothetical protein
MIVIVFTIVWLRFFVDSPTSYRRFTKKDSFYHKTVAEECEHLFQNATENPKATLSVNPENPDLPKILREFHPYEIEIGKDLKVEDRIVSFVTLKIRSSTGAYSVIWEPCIGAEAEWQLAAYQEGHQSVLWKTNVSQRVGAKTNGRLERKR